MIFIDRATFSGSSQSMVSGLPVFTPQKPQERVQTFPKIIKVAVPSPQHSPMFGQLPEVQMVFRLYLSTNPRNSVYFCPMGNFTFNHFGLPTGKVLSVVVSISSFFRVTKIGQSCFEKKKLTHQFLSEFYIKKAELIVLLF
jgi:hypothetical protein